MSTSAEVPRISPAAEWVVDRQGILVVGSAQPRWLHGTEAAVWSWLSAGRSRAGLELLLAAYLAIEPPEAQRSLGVILESWTDAGLLDCAGRVRG